MDIDNDYLAFLRSRIPELSRAQIPLLHRSLFPKNNTLEYCLNNKRLYAGKPGVIAEFGVWKGRTLNMIAKAFPNQCVYGFDSFTGFPDDGRRDWKLDFSVDGRPPKTRANVELIRGYFNDTLPDFVARHRDEYFSFIHIDCDIYSSTKTIFEICAEMIKPGCIIVFDELLHYHEFAENEMLALYEYIKASNYDFEWVGIRGKVMDVDRILFQPETLPQGGFKYWRKDGYMQEAAIRIISS